MFYLLIFTNIFSQEKSLEESKNHIRRMVYHFGNVKSNNSLYKKIIIFIIFAK